eukprot:m.246164 g.246164  ORF g.246164 m.246164 type:complete len:88 (-) comp67956_c0_seq1:10-273(-)
MDGLTVGQVVDEDDYVDDVDDVAMDGSQQAQYEDDDVDDEFHDALDGTEPAKEKQHQSANSHLVKLVSERFFNFVNVCIHAHFHTHT